MHQGAIAYGPQKRRPLQSLPHHGDAEIQRFDLNPVTRAVNPVLESLTIVLERGLVLGRAIQIIEYHRRQPRLRDPAQIRDVNGAIEPPHASLSGLWARLTIGPVSQGSKPC